MWFINGRCGFCVCPALANCVWVPVWVSRWSCVNPRVRAESEHSTVWSTGPWVRVHRRTHTKTQQNLIRAIPVKMQTCQGLFRLPNRGKLSAWQGLKVSFMTCIGIVHRGMQDAETRTVSEHIRQRYVPGSLYNMWLTTVKYFWYASLEIFIVSHIFPLCGARVIMLWEDLNFFQYLHFNDNIQCTAALGIFLWIERSNMFIRMMSVRVLCTKTHTQVCRRI